MWRSNRDSARLTTFSLHVASFDVMSYFLFSSDAMCFIVFFITYIITSSIPPVTDTFPSFHSTFPADWVTIPIPSGDLNPSGKLGVPLVFGIYCAICCLCTSNYRRQPLGQYPISSVSKGSSIRPDAYTVSITSLLFSYALLSVVRPPLLYRYTFGTTSTSVSTWTITAA